MKGDVKVSLSSVSYKPIVKAGSAILRENLYLAFFEA
jgi:hypothetical protein